MLMAELGPEVPQPPVGLLYNSAQLMLTPCMGPFTRFFQNAGLDQGLAQGATAWKGGLTATNNMSLGGPGGSVLLPARDRGLEPEQYLGPQPA